MGTKETNSSCITNILINTLSCIKFYFMELYPSLILSIVFGILFLMFLFATVVSCREKEKRASAILSLLSILSALAVGALLIFSDTFNSVFGQFFLLGLVVGLLFFLIPLKNRSKFMRFYPDGKFDERLIPFSRNRLVDGQKHYQEFYSSHPDLKAGDDQIRKMPGLLSSMSKKFRLSSFYAAHSNFTMVDIIKPYVNGVPSQDKKTSTPAQFSRFIENWLLKQRAHSVGFCELKDYHSYNVSGKLKDYGKEIDLTHKYAIVFTVEMDKDLISMAPEGPAVMESSRIYMNSGLMAVNVANFIRNLGYPARAHIDGNYEIICPLVARDAGLGELGRMGLLITPELGPRVRIAAITTDLPLEIVEKPIAAAIIDFCRLCKKCSDNCPVQAISFLDNEDDGIGSSWKINKDACYSYWNTNGTDCAKCVSVCPFSHPNNTLHNFIRWGIQNNYFFRNLAVHLDDFFYGRKIKSQKAPDWMDL